MPDAGSATAAVPPRTAAPSLDASLPSVPGGADTWTLLLHAEALGVFKRIRRTSIRAARFTRLHEAVVEEDLLREDVSVQRVPVGRVVEAMPPVREEGDLVIVPVVEEVLVVERRLILKEEVHLRRTRSTQRHVETVRLREQDVVVTRVPLDD